LIHRDIGGEAEELTSQLIEAVYVYLRIVLVNQNLAMKGARGRYCLPPRNP
jgi:hypothetical protein